MHLRASGVSLVLDVRGGRLPRVLHWGADLGDLAAADLAALATTAVPPLTPSSSDEVVPVSLLPEQSLGWLGTPGVTGHRGGAHFSVAFAVDDVVTTTDAGGTQQVRVLASDAAAGLDLDLVVELLPTGLLRSRAQLTSTGPGTFTLGTLDLAFPVPTEADEILDFTGRHLRERAPQRAPFDIGTRLRESRGARAHGGTLLLVAGRAGFGYRAGEVWGVHVAWSGNTRTFAERTPAADRLLGGGELLLAGEVGLGPFESYTSPWVYGSYGNGLDELSARFHRWLRSRPQHPTSARPVLVNVWEAVYFDHDLDRLRELADRAASIGVERYVLDDGWFRHRRDDHAGLGDWYVDEDVWPDGLTPLVDHVRSLGMQFGLWFEPEMVNPDSDLARAHPEWILRAGNRLPPSSRYQQVLDLAQPEALAYVLERLDAIITEHKIDFVKWDHNRDLVDAGHGPTGRAGVHEQTLATYRLMDVLRSRHPQLEIESCASGGGRVDLGILDRTDRVWASDTIDALERQTIEAGTGLLLPPELIGSHIGAPTAHTTGRTHTLGFRAGTAFFSHLGIEWDLTAATDDDLAGLAAWIAAHKQHRALLHHGTVVRSDHPDPALRVHGVVAPDGAEAVFAVVTVGTTVTSPPGRVRLPGLEPDAAYDVRPLPPGDAAGHGDALYPAPWWSHGARLTGRTLDAVGVQVPSLFPERLVLLHARRAPSGPATD